jgi:hypothetical protein
MLSFLAEEIAPVRDRGAAASDGPREDLLRGFPDLDPCITGKTIDPSPRVQPSLVEDLTGIDIADACYAALIHEERFYGRGASLSNLQ